MTRIGILGALIKLGSVPYTDRYMPRNMLAENPKVAPPTPSIKPEDVASVLEQQTGSGRYLYRGSSMRGRGRYLHQGSSHYLYR